MQYNKLHQSRFAVGSMPVIVLMLAITLAAIMVLILCGMLVAQIEATPGVPQITQIVLMPLV